MAKIKISYIGAGSTTFSLSLVKSLCRTSSLAGSTVSFMDIDQKRLDSIHQICSRYAALKGATLNMEKTTNRKESLQGADFVVTTALASGYSRLQAGWEIARRYGVMFPGSFAVMYDEAFWINFYQLRLFESLTEDIAALCPKAWHLLVANPVLAGVTHLSRKYPEARLIGICHGFTGIYEVANILGLERSRLSFEIPGVNHFVWLNRFEHEGKDAFPLLDRWIAEKAVEFWKSKKIPGRSALSPKAVDLYKKHGVLPIGDTAHWGGGTWPWWYHSDDAVQGQWGESDPQGAWDSYFAGAAAFTEKIAEASRGDDAGLAAMMEKVHEESIVDMIESLACDVPRTLIVNVPNTGAFVPGVPRDFEVEVPALLSARGIQPRVTKELPRSIIGHTLRDRVGPTELELDAYARGSKDLLVELVLMDRWVKSARDARALVEEILAMSQHEELRGHYR